MKPIYINQFLFSADLTFKNKGQNKLITSPPPHILYYTMYFRSQQILGTADLWAYLLRHFINHVCCWPFFVGMDIHSGFEENVILKENQTKWMKKERK